MANLAKAMKCIKKVLDKEWGKLTFEYKLEKNRVSISANLSVKLAGEDRSVLVLMSVYESGFSSISFYFDKLDENSENLRLLNKFNDETPFFKAMIDEDGDLYLNYPFVTISETDPGVYIDRMLNQLLSDSFEEDFTPILNNMG